MRHGREATDVEPYERDLTEPAPTVDTKAIGAWSIVRPATTVTGDPRVSPPVHHDKGMNSGGQVTTEELAQRWAQERPATTIVGSFCPDVVAAPGYRTETSRQNAEGSIKITERDALVLQSFRPDYPLRGSRTKRFEQVGNAVPPVLAAFVVGALTGRTAA